MKKIIAVLIVILMLASCGEENGVLKENADSSSITEVSQNEPEKKEREEQKDEVAVQEKSCVAVESGKASGKICVQVYNKKWGETELSGDAVDFSFDIPDGWEAEVLEEENSVYGFSFVTHESNDNRAFFVLYKDDGTVYDELLGMNSLLVGIDEYTYHEVSGNFSKGSYIHFSYPTSDKYDVDENHVPVYGRFYQLQFDGYVVAANVYIRIDSEKNTLFDEKLCDEFISSVTVG